MVQRYDDQALHRQAAALGERMRPRGWRLAAAESCTGGWLTKVVTDVEGSSEWLEAGFVTYSNQAKQRHLGVEAETLARHGAVSEATVLEMAQGALQAAAVDVAVSISGIAGPGGGTPDKPVGTVWIGWAGREIPPRAKRFQFAGDREAVRRQTVAAALAGLEALLG